ncbi:hypothetical protein SDC9_100022 [bioreactor metagenome]|uniref:Uncharacterized protein n=1 Tax=bioreactor metagenome TaxID=1076179 RepID=A0A645AJZ7_9ZZZZ
MNKCRIGLEFTIQPRILRLRDVHAVAQVVVDDGSDGNAVFFQRLILQSHNIPGFHLEQVSGILREQNTSIV